MERNSNKNEKSKKLKQSILSEPPRNMIVNIIDKPFIQEISLNIGSEERQEL